MGRIKIWSVYQMLRWGAHSFCVVMQRLQEFENATALGNVSAEDRPHILTHMLAIMHHCATMESDAGISRANRIQIKLQSRGLYHWKDFQSDVKVLRETIEDQLSKRTFTFVPVSRATYFENASCFGVSVAEKFPSAVPDILEASNCYAAGRNTACVFHLMRVMERALRSLAKALGIPYAPSWESYLKQISDKVSQKYKTKGVKWKRDEPFFRDVSGDLLNVKIAWRNPTMHVVRDYSEQEALEVLTAVRGLMVRMSTRLSDI